MATAIYNYNVQISISETYNSLKCKKLFYIISATQYIDSFLNITNGIFANNKTLKCILL